MYSLRFSSKDSKTKSQPTDFFLHRIWARFKSDIPLRFELQIHANMDIEVLPRFLFATEIEISVPFERMKCLEGNFV